MAHFGLGGRRKQRLGKLVALLEPGRHRHSLDGAALLVLGPRRTRDIPANDALHVDALRPPDDHRLPGKVGGDIQPRPLGSPGDEVVGHDIFGLLEPEVGDLAQHGALVRHRRGQDDVESGYPVRRHHEEQLVVHLVGVPDLPTVDQVGQGGFLNRDHLVHLHVFGSRETLESLL